VADQKNLVSAIKNPSNIQRSTRFLDFSISSRFKTNNKIKKAGANETTYANKQCPLLILSAGNMRTAIADAAKLSQAFNT
jgi:hypothetical protein